jgi:hypothetical protein
MVNICRRYYMYQYTEELKVYGIQGSDYIKESGAITCTGFEGRATAEDVITYFNNSKYATKPNQDYTIPGHGKLIGADLTNVLTRKVWADVDAMKSAVLSDSYLATINTHAAHAEYYLTSENALQIKLYFETEAKRNSWLDAVKDRADSQFKDSTTQRVVVTTL